MNWISTKDKLPDHVNDILIYGMVVCDCCGDKGPKLFIGFWEAAINSFQSEYKHWITVINALYWMEIPKLPNEQN